LGTLIFRLADLDAVPDFAPDSHKGHKMQAKGYLVRQPGAERIGGKPPRQFQLVEIRGVDLVQRRIAGAGSVIGVMQPIGIARTGRGALRKSGRMPQQGGGRRPSQHHSTIDHSSTVP